MSPPDDLYASTAARSPSTTPFRQGRKRNKVTFNKYNKAGNKGKGIEVKTTIRCFYTEHINHKTPNKEYKLMSKDECEHWKCKKQNKTKILSTPWSEDNVYPSQTVL